MTPPRDGTCFYEADPDLSLARRAGAEAVGSFVLTFTVIASALSWSHGGGLAAVARALSVGPTLTALILLFGSISGGHFNPLISLSQWLGRRRSVACLAAYVVAQLIGAVLAAYAASAAFGPAPAGQAAGPLPTLVAAELFATAGLMLIVVGASRMLPAGVGPFAVGGFVAMTIAGLPTGPAANPIISAAAFVSGLAPSLSAGAVHLAAEASGLALALLATFLIVPQGAVSDVR